MQPGQSYAAYKVTLCMHGVLPILNAPRESSNFSLESNQFVGRKNIMCLGKTKPPTLHCLSYEKEMVEQVAPYVSVRRLLPSAVGEQHLAHLAPYLLAET